jgi:hypothetical protein
MASLRSRIGSDLLTLASLFFMAGSLAITASSRRRQLARMALRGKRGACVGGAIFVGRRISRYVRFYARPRL